MNQSDAQSGISDYAWDTFEHPYEGKFYIAGEEVPEAAYRRHQETAKQLDDAHKTIRAAFGIPEPKHETELERAARALLEASYAAEPEIKEGHPLYPARVRLAEALRRVS